MNVFSFDNVLSSPVDYVDEAISIGFYDVTIGDQTFKNIQARGDDEFSRVVNGLMPNYEINYNFIRQSPLNQDEPNFIHKDDMMGEITIVLYLNEKHPDNDGTTIYDQDGKAMCVLYSKFNRMVGFSSDSPHSRNIFENFGEGNDARLIQVMFLRRND